MILTGGTKSTDILYVQAYHLLKNKGIHITKVSYIRNGDAAITTEIIEFWAKESVEFITQKLKTRGEFNDEVTYFDIEAEVFDWYNDLLSEGSDIYMIFQGGHAALNMALQRAANLFGCTSTFQMYFKGLRDENPKTINEVNDALAANKLTFIENGGERGWPALKNIPRNENTYKIIKGIKSTIESSQSQDIFDIPFECLTLLPSEVHNWLSKVVSESDRDWIKVLPKTDLHCHLGGFAVDGEALEMVRNAGVNGGDTLGELKNIVFPDGWPKPDFNISLSDYFALGDNTGSYILHSLDALEKQCELMYDHFISENLRYVEVRCSPYNYVRNGNSVTDVISTILSTFNACMKQANKHLKRWCHVNLIIIATRKIDRSTQDIESHLRLAIDSESTSSKLSRCKVVGVDLAGYEIKETRAAIYAANFEPVNRAGIMITIHAGENDEAEGIWEALLKLNARRIGHGLNISDDPKLLKWIVNHRTGIEMCPYANYQIKGFRPKLNENKFYPLSNYLSKNVCVSVNTDNIGISRASITDNFLLAVEMNPELSRMDILRLIRNGIDLAFVDVELRNILLRIFNEDIYEILLKEVF